MAGGVISDMYIFALLAAIVQPRPVRNLPPINMWICLACEVKRAPQLVDSDESSRRYITHMRQVLPTNMDQRRPTISGIVDEGKNAVTWPTVYMPLHGT